MDIGIVSSRYAKALFKYANEHKEAALTYHAMDRLCLSFSEVETLKDSLQNPVLADTKKFNLLVIASGNPTGKCIQEFFRLVIAKKRLEMIHYMAISYMELYRRENHLIQSDLTIAADLDEDIVGRLKELVQEQTHCDIEFKVTTDKSIIGGFILDFDSMRYDASIQGKLQRIRKRLLSTR